MKLVSIYWTGRVSTTTTASTPEIMSRQQEIMGKLAINIVELHMNTYK
jgi:hypothetical protein